jgi:uncharacterized membrane protein (TIGR01666 family)
MNYTKKYINFINGRYASEGLRITAGILFPSFVMNLFHLLPVGIVMSLGALCVSAADTPGAVKHRFNGMFACNILVTALSVIVSYATGNNLILGLVITISSFFFSMLTVYGNRSSAVGIASLLIMVLSLQTPLDGMHIWVHAGYILAGGVWYMLYSLALYRLRPYKFIQQVLADYVSDVAAYLKLRGDLYALDPAYDKINIQLLQQQINIEAHQQMLSDLLFNTRTIVKESTHTGRVLVKTYLEVAELYESVMTTYQQYHILHQQFDESHILEEYQQIIYLLAAEMEEISIALKSGVSSSPAAATDRLIQKARQQFEELRQHMMNENNLENFVSLGRIVKNLEDIGEKINRLHLYTTYEVNLKKGDIESSAYSGWVSADDIRPSLFFNNLNFKSNVFRHSLRVALALLAGFIIAIIFKVDRGYWILLTIVVILKPAYALSKRRNADRLIGTALGIMIGLLIILIIKNDTALLAIMIFFMAGSYMFIRTNYFMTVLLMTPYLLIFFHYLYPGELKELMIERIIDTAIGSLIAFFASLFLIPAWERNSIKSYMLKMLEVNEIYYSSIALHFCSAISINKEQIKINRREVLVALANLSDAFTRMLSEPRRYRQGVKNVHAFVVINHTLISHLATLSYLLQNEKLTYRSPDLLPVIKNTQLYFKNALLVLSRQPEEIEKPDSIGLKRLNEKVQDLLEKRKAEIAEGLLETPAKKLLVETKSVTDQFNYIFSDAAVIYKICSELENEMMSIK